MFGLERLDRCRVCRILSRQSRRVLLGKFRLQRLNCRRMSRRVVVVLL